jgi:hypothetical protein
MDRRNFLKTGLSLGIGATFAPALFTSCKKEQSEPVKFLWRANPAMGENAIEMDWTLKKISVFSSSPQTNMQAANYYDGLPGYHVQFEFYQDNGQDLQPILRLAGKTSEYHQIMGIQNNNPVGREVDTYCHFNSLTPVDAANSHMMHANGWFINAGNPQIAYIDPITGSAVQQLTKINFTTPSGGAPVVCYLNDAYATQGEWVMGINTIEYPLVSSLQEANDFLVNQLMLTNIENVDDRATAFTLNFLDCGLNPEFVAANDWMNGLSFYFEPDNQSDYHCKELRRFP